MKTSIKISIFLFSYLLLSPFPGISQHHQNEHPAFEVHEVHPYISVSKKQLTEANHLWDLKNTNNHLNLEYQPDWVSKYLSVEIQVCQDGVIKKATSKNDSFTKEQKTLLKEADYGKDINVLINYLPKNNLVNNEPKTINFSLSLDPENSAVFSGGEEALYQYFEKNIINKISASSFENYDMTAIKFNINAVGNIHQAEIFGAEYQSGKFATINQQLLAAVQSMPSWEPATYADGTKAEQAFVLTVGSKENCVLPLLNIGR